MAKKKRKSRPIAEARRKSQHLEPLLVFGLALLLVFFLSISWRKWPDPLIDFGRELYIPWRIANGAVLYRDLGGHYGPLSQYFNALLFRMFGPGLMVLVVSNLIILVAILALLYLLCRRAWGPMAAFAACATFICVFSFSQLTGIANYNYLAPYAHETTHGILISLGFVCVLSQWVIKPGWSLSAWCGLLFGLLVLLKPEFILAATFVSFGAVAIRLRYYRAVTSIGIGAVLVGAVVTTLAFTLYFAATLRGQSPLQAASTAWFRFVTSGSHGLFGGIQNRFDGLDQPLPHLLQHATATLVGLTAIAGLVGGIWLSRKIRLRSLAVAVAIGMSAVIAIVSWLWIDWLEAGKCLLGLTVIYIGIHSVGLYRNQSKELPSQEVPRLLLAILAAALMARMVLNGRIYHYGFYQAAIAGSILPAILVGELPELIQAKDRERIFLWILIGALLIPGLAQVAKSSYALFRLKTFPIAEGRDRFYSFPRRIEATGEMVAAAVRELNKGDKPKSLLVLPEGIMINYLARIPRTYELFYGHFASSPQLISDFEKDPPERVVMISRDLREYGVQKFGEKPGRGAEILSWLSEHYLRYAHAGGDPLDPRQRGVVFFRRKD